MAIKTAESHAKVSGDIRGHSLEVAEDDAQPEPDTVLLLLEVEALDQFGRAGGFRRFRFRDGFLPCGRLLGGGLLPCGGLRLAGDLALMVVGDVSPGVVAGDVVDGLVGFRVVRA